MKKEAVGLWRVKDTALASSGNKIWNSPFHGTLAELDNGILPGVRSLPLQ